MPDDRTITVTLTVEEAESLTEAAGDGSTSWDEADMVSLDSATEKISRALWPLRFPDRPYPGQ